MNRLLLMAFTASVFSVNTIFAQAVSFSNPAPWLTQRNDTVFLRAQLDTALLKKKTISVSLSQVNNGKKKVLTKKNINVTDNIIEISLGCVGKDFVGGSEYLSLQWTVPGSEEKGTIEPIGILNIQKMKKTEPVKAVHVANDAKVASVSDAIKDQNFIKVGANEFAAAWNKDAFFIVIKKSQDGSVLQFGFDGKNGKNAFISYPDRIVSYNLSNDSLKAIHYVRQLVADSLKYSENKWNSEIKKEMSGNKVVISIPWADIGVIPFEERMVGFGVFSIQNDGKVSASVPDNAQILIPGTWSDVFLQK